MRFLCLSQNLNKNFECSIDTEIKLTSVSFSFLSGLQRLGSSTSVAHYKTVRWEKEVGGGASKLINIMDERVPTLRGII
jgi:hypothetical protein